MFLLLISLFFIFCSFIEQHGCLEIVEKKKCSLLIFDVTDLGSGEEKVRKIETKVFVGNTATNTAKTELTKFAVERGMPWHSALELWRRCGTMEEGFYCSLQVDFCHFNHFSFVLLCVCLYIYLYIYVAHIFTFTTMYLQV